MVFHSIMSFPSQLSTGKSKEGGKQKCMGLDPGPFTHKMIFLAYGAASISDSIIKFKKFKYDFGMIMCPVKNYFQVKYELPIHGLLRLSQREATP